MSETINTPRQETVTAGISEAKLLGSLKHLFASSFSVLGELMQNARRARASGVTFDFDPDQKTLTVCDDGTGIADFQNLVVLAQSGWDDETMLTENPFGMGLFSVLFACEEVTFRSRGRRLRVSIDAVVEKRAIAVDVDESAPVQGTRIEMRNLAPNLLPAKHEVPSAGIVGLARYEMVEELRAYAQGFAIPVRLNGEDLPRPFAQENIPGEKTDIGFVSVYGIHRAPDRQVVMVNAHAYNVYFLQGLPINGSAVRNGTPCVIVHLDNASFIPKMPDRAHLYDQERAFKRISTSLTELVERYLVDRKAKLTPKEFASRHWTECKVFRRLDLMNDVPWIPASLFFRIGAILESSERMMDRCTALATTAQGDPEAHLLSREDVEQGKFRIWRNTPYAPSASRAAALLLKVMQREEVLALADNLPEGHWLNLCTPDCEGFTFDVHASGCAGKADYHAGDWMSKVTIQLASQAEIVINDPDQRMTPLRCIVEDDWLLLPAGFTERKAFNADLPFGDHEAVCLVIGRGIRWDHPVDALSSYTDENDEYRDDWQENSARLWNALVSGLRGDSIADLVATALNTCTEVVASECHLPHMAVVRTTLAEPGTRVRNAPRMEVVCLQDDAFWESFAASFDSAGDTALKQRLRDAFVATVRPGEIIRTAE
ncbi:ATP-binding protein [Ramlibacter albus]|uniref:ATP-binding protein n=1 Tax=Ramlibacter albus TaxID=2079448 RepID=A0A923S534_9BURK|nr:ATP-binding protein [Ramlibacter albus]MBC5767528.1 ATP-binding protein [Ramlibacter albus]